MTEAQRKKAKLIQLLIAKGWNPPTPTSAIVERIADDMERIANRKPHNDPTAATLDLSPAQLRAITLAAQGYTAPESAQLLGNSTETVKTHIKDANRRLGAKNTAHAVAICIRNGLINVSEQARAA